VHDEFRIEVQVPPDRAHTLLNELRSLERRTLADVPAPKHVAVSHEHGHLFLYADSQEDTAAAKAALVTILAKLQIGVTPTARRWHPEEERWEDISAPLPSTPAEHASEHERLEQLETEESEQAGRAEWEVRVTLPTHHDAREFAERLQSEGYLLRRHWRHLQLGARDEDDANALAARLRAEAPQGSEIEVEGDAADAWAEVTAPARPFSIFGGLAQ
jgi:cell division septation protein DedD